MQGSTWPRLREAWEAAGRAGFDSLWTEDHLLADAGDWPYDFETMERLPELRASLAR